MTYQPKYNTVQAKYPPGKRPPGTHGVYAQPEYYTPQGIIDQDIKYAWMKHRSQAAYRGEDHSITLEEWRELWPNELWFQRGRSVGSLCLSKLDIESGWSIDNVEICTRRKYLKRAKDYRDANR